ncbi:hypothetical protein L6164_009928 [Bauhinia variegata]|uniref:Uncharacterized protein n=1 Tax=Bauhinia variegata TaxID=167791 RepID=A0ACB9PLK8_BAUVA|nr:hypothetical protein L6164_009928 [Bauhinia variegata]
MVSKSMPVVLDISSDEESGLNELSKTDYAWIKEFLGESDTESDDSEEVVVIGEVKPERKSKSSRPAVIDVDDDCVVLDGDPEDRVTTVNETEIESDELLIVGEKGPIACRDYPHPRHLCAKFPFSSTPHETHCGQCHCYVCDTLAPCLQWGTGVSHLDHCHASEKVETWKTLRKNFKLGTSAPLPASTNYTTSPYVALLQQNQVPEHDIIVLPPSSVSQSRACSQAALRSCSSLNATSENQSSGPGIMHARSLINSTIQNQVSGPNINAIPFCSSTTNYTVPDSVNPGRCQESVPTLARTRYQPHMVPRQMFRVRNTSIRRERGRGMNTLGPQFLRSNTISQRLGNAGGTVTVDLDSSGYSNYANQAQHYDQYHAATELLNIRNPNAYVWSSNNLSSHSHPSTTPPSVNCVSANTTPFESQAYGQPLSQSNDSQNFYESCIPVPGHNAPSSYVACTSGNQYGNGQHQIGTQNENGSQNVIQCGIPSQDACQQKPHEENQSEVARKADFSGFNSSWTGKTSPSNEPLVESCHLQGSGSINQGQPPNVKESNTQFGGSSNFGHLDEFEEWLFQKESSPVVAYGAVPSELNLPSPEIPQDEAGMFSFDFDTSWNGPGHV